jgi:hypothetical protein
MFKPVGLEETGTAKLERKTPQDTEPRRKRERVRDQGAEGCKSKPLALRSAPPSYRSYMNDSMARIGSVCTYDINKII